MNHYNSRLRKTLFGTPGKDPGPFNPKGLDSNCVACVAAVIKSKFKKRLFTAEDIVYESGPVDIETGNLGRVSTVTNPAEAIAYVEKATGGKAIKVQGKNALEPGHYAIVFPRGNGHIIYKYVSPAKRVVIYDPQQNLVIKNFDSYASAFRYAPEQYKITQD